MVFSATVNNISVISWREDDVCFALDKTRLVGFSKRKQQSLGRHVDSHLRYIRKNWKTVIDISECLARSVLFQINRYLENKQTKNMSTISLVFAMLVVAL